MLTRIDLLIWFLGAWIASFVAYGLLKRRQGTKLPSGSVEVGKPQMNLGGTPPGAAWSRWGVIAGMGVNSFLTVVVFVLCAFDLWDAAAPFIAVDLPTSFNWTGIAGIWVTDLWGVAVTYYNASYVPANRPMHERSALLGSGHGGYVLATGGPYRWVRHPMYVSKIVYGLFLFLATGIWLAFFCLIAAVSLPTQARGEEELLRSVFGKAYDDYAARTGRFVPRVRNPD
jgi:protein-S-isoprenylcysteine O-methyltransferase Ste14